MARQILIVFLALAVSAAYGAIVENCGGTATLNAVDVEGCADSVNGRCQFQKGRSYSVQVDASASKCSTNICPL